MLNLPQALYMISKLLWHLGWIECPGNGYQQNLCVLGIKVPNCDFLTIIPFNQNHQEQRMIRRRVIGCLLGLLFLTGIHTKAAVAVYVMDNGVRTDHVAFNKIETEVVDMLAGEVRLPTAKRSEDHATLVAGLIVERAPRVKLISVRTLKKMERAVGRVSRKVFIGYRITILLANLRWRI